MKMKLRREEKETIINFNAGEKTATVYTRDRSVMRRFDALVNEYPEQYQLVGATDIDRTYTMPKSFISYRKPRQITEEQRAAARERMRKLNNGGV